MNFTCKVCGNVIQIEGEDLGIALAYCGDPENLAEFTCEACECKETGAVA